MNNDSVPQPQALGPQDQPGQSHLQTDSADRSPGASHYLLLAVLLLVTAFVYLLGNDRIALWDRDEPRFAQASREMIERQDFILPHFNNTYRFDKPVLIYWLMAANYRLFGISEFSARLGSSLAGLLACVLMYFLAAKLFNRYIALMATAILASCPLFVIESKLATADALLSVFLVAVLGLWLSMQRPNPRWYHAVLLGLALGLGTLTKGPVIWLFLWAGSLATVILRTQRRNLRPLFLVIISVAGLAAVFLCLRIPQDAQTPQQITHLLAWLGILLLLLSLPVVASISQPFQGPRPRMLMNFCLVLLGLTVAALVFLPWGLAAIIKTQGAFWSQGVARHVIQRSSESLEGHWGPPGYYLASWIVCAFPWSVLAPLAIWKAWPIRWHNYRLAALLGWAIGPWLVLEAVQTKLVHYTLGCYPALAILIAYLLYDWRDDLAQKLKSRLLGRMALSALWIIAIVVAAALLAFVAFLCVWPLAELPGSDLPRYALLLSALLASLLVLAVGLLVRKSLAKGRPRTAVALGFVGAMLWAAVTGGLVAPAISSYRISPQAAAAAKELSPEAARFVLFGFDEPSIIWYLDAHAPVQIAGTPEELISAYEGQEPICVIIHKDKMDKLSAAGFEPTDPGKWVEGLYLNKLRKAELWIGLNKAALKKKPD